MPMRIVTINIPDQYLACIECMVQAGLWASRSDAVRAALKEFLNKDPLLLKEISDMDSFATLINKYAGDLFGE